MSESISRSTRFWARRSRRQSSWVGFGSALRNKSRRPPGRSRPPRGSAHSRPRPGGRGRLVGQDVAVHGFPSGLSSSRVQRGVVFMRRAVQLDVVFEQGKWAGPCGWDVVAGGSRNLPGDGRDERCATRGLVDDR